jgi:hypothetical protein
MYIAVLVEFSSAGKYGQKMMHELFRFPRGVPRTLKNPIYVC